VRLRLLPRNQRGHTLHTVDPQRASYNVRAGGCGRFNVLPLTALGVLWAQDVCLGVPLCECYELAVTVNAAPDVCYVGAVAYVTCDWVGYVA
jgi:hypothetical protein